MRYVLVDTDILINFLRVKNLGDVDAYGALRSAGVSDSRFMQSPVQRSPDALV